MAGYFQTRTGMATSLRQFRREAFLKPGLHRGDRMLGRRLITTPLRLRAQLPGRHRCFTLLQHGLDEVTQAGLGLRTDRGSG
jgi:hypothetical protein